MSDEARARAIQQRRLRLGIPHVTDAAELSKRLDMYISRDAITAAEKGTASPGTYQRLTAVYDVFEEETGNAMPPTEDDERFVTFELTGIYGAESVIVRGPVSDLEEIQRAVERLLRGKSDE